MIAFQTMINHSFWIFYIGRKDLYNKQKSKWLLANTRLTSRVEHDISTREINLVFPRTHVLLSI